jgi:hypothetical protein
MPNRTFADLRDSVPSGPNQVVPQFADVEPSFVPVAVSVLEEITNAPDGTVAWASDGMKQGDEDGWLGCPVYSSHGQWLTMYGDQPVCVRTWTPQ